MGKFGRGRVGDGSMPAVMSRACPRVSFSVRGCLTDCIDKSGFDIEKYVPSFMIIGAFLSSFYFVSLSHSSTLSVEVKSILCA